MAENSTNKRRRKEGLQLLDLPDNAVAQVAIYLSNVSRAIFALASPSAMKSTILSSDEKLWETLDFGDIDKSLARKLTDDNIRDILTIIDAVNNTKCLKLTGCTTVFGTGLSPLRGSVVLKQLDLGLVDQYKSPHLHPQPSISEESVMPILTSIINAEGNSMTHLQLPQKWRSNEESTLLATFLTRYNEVLISRQSKCKACDRLVNGGSRIHVIISTDGNCGLQNFICYTCLESFCNVCIDEDQHGRRMLSFCSNCEKDYCVDCNETKGCDGCDETFCSGCDNLKSCTTCNDVFCSECAPSKKCACVNEVCRECTEETKQLCKWEGCEEVFCSNCQDEHLLSHRMFTAHLT